MKESGAGNLPEDNRYLKPSLPETHSALDRFSKIPSGQPFTPNNKSGDYSLQLMMGMRNFKQWQHDQKPLLLKLILGAAKYSFNTDWKLHLRTGPTTDYYRYPAFQFRRWR